jgi:hypothetical protein
MFIPNPNISIPDRKLFHPGCASKSLNILTQKMVSKHSEILSGFFIPDSEPDFLLIPDPDIGKIGYLIK